MSRLPASLLSAPIAHRGLHDRSRGVIENSMSAVRAAIAGGYGIEIDLQPSRDEIPMVFHDYELDRLAGLSGTIRSKNASDLGSVVLTGGRDTVPTLEAVLDETAGQVPLLIEIKDQDQRLGPDVTDFQKHICAVVAGYTGPLALMSFNPHAVRAVQTLAPDVPVGLVTDPFLARDWPDVPQDRRAELAEIPDADRLDVDFISHNQAYLDCAPVHRLKARGLPVLCWTIRSAEAEARAREIADNVTFEGYTPARHSA